MVKKNYFIASGTIFYSPEYLKEFSQKSTKIPDPAGYSFYQYQQYDIEVEAYNN